MPAQLVVKEGMHGEHAQKSEKLKRKLTLVILLTCSLVLLLACGVLGAYQLIDFREMTVRDTTVLAEVLADEDAEALEDVGCHRDHLDVGPRLGRAPHLEVDLVELALAALLRRFAGTVDGARHPSGESPEGS